MAVNNELEWIWKEIFVAYCKVFTQQLPSATRENEVKPSPKQPIFRTVIIMYCVFRWGLREVAYKFTDVSEEPAAACVRIESIYKEDLVLIMFPYDFVVFHSVMESSSTHRQRSYSK
jgi:hypothetical protein